MDDRCVSNQERIDKINGEKILVAQYSGYPTEYTEEHQNNANS